MAVLPQNTEALLRELSIFKQEFAQLKKDKEACEKELISLKRQQILHVESETLQIEKDRFRKILDSIVDPVFVKDNNHCIRLANQAFFDIFKLSEEQTIGKTLIEAVPENERSHFLKIDRAVLDTGVANICEEELTIDNFTKTIITKKSCFIDNSNQKYLVGTIHDITDIKISSNQLIETKKYLESLIDYANAPIIVWDPNFKITRFNHAFEAITGRTEMDVLGEYIEILFPKKSADKSMDEIWKTVSGERWESVEIEILHLNQSISTLLWNSATIFSQDGITPIATIAQGHNITIRKQNEKIIKHKNEELQLLNSSKDKFFSIIAHDLKSPFNTILGFSNLLLNEIKKNNLEGIEEYAEIIMQSSKRASSLLMNLMEWAQSQTGRMEYHPETLKILDVVDENIKLYLPIASKKGIKIDTSIPNDVSLFVDNAMIHTVFRNLISNAIKFTNPGGLITISTCSSENYVTVSVKDTGIGIPKNNLEKIFLIDSKHSTLGTEKEKGTGLGLILCKEFVEKNLGKIWAESIEGVGSTIYFTLPVKAN